MSRESGKEYRWLEGFALLLSCIAIQLVTEVMTQWGTYFYSPPQGVGSVVYISIKWAGYMFVITYIVSAITDPIIALWSDRTNTRPGRWRLFAIRGRRRPFIFWGSIGATVTGILFWFPPFAETTNANVIYATVILCIHWGLFCSLCSSPFNALGPEIARSREARVRIGTWIAAGMILGLAIAEIAPGVLVDWLTPVSDKAAVVELAVSSPVGFQRMAILFSIIALAFFQFTVWTVRERYQSSEASAVTPPLSIILQTLRNRVFVKYMAMFFLFNLGYLAVQRVLPYWVKVGLGGSPGMVSALMAPYILFALAALVFTGPLARHIPIKWLVFISIVIITTGLPMMYCIAILGVTSSTKIVLGAILFSYCGIGQGMQYVLLTPMIGEIIDLDEKRSGERREAIYQSVSGLAWKGSQALSVLVATRTMDLFGNSVEHPTGIYLVGPIAGVLGLLALAVCWTYPVLRVTKETDGVKAEG